MTYPVIVLLPGAADWPDIVDVVVASRGAVSDAWTGTSPEVEIELALDVDATDDALDEVLERVATAAVGRGGFVIDARSGTVIAAPEREIEPPVDDPGPIWEHLPGTWDTAPASGVVVDALPVIDTIERGIADEGGPSLDDDVRVVGVSGAFRRGLEIVFGQPRRLATVVVLLVVLLVPVLPLVSLAVGSFLSTFVVAALLPVTYIRRDEATARVSLLWLGGVGALCALLTVPWVGTLVWLLLFVPMLAVAAAAWITGSWRRGGRAVARLFRRSWFRTIVVTIVASWTYGILFSVPAAIFWDLGDLPGVVSGVVGTAFQVMITAFGIGYATVAVEESTDTTQHGAPTEVPT